MARTDQRRRRSSRPAPDPSHLALRGVLRILGPLLIVAGIAFTVAGVYSFNKSFNERRESFGQPFSVLLEPERKESSPDRFWMCFLGFPLIGIGIFATKVGFLGTAARYVVHETRDSVSVLAGAVAEGIREGYDGEEEGVDCRACGVANDPEARFCDNCGKAISSRPICPACRRENDAAAKFCDGCGSRIVPERG